MKSKTAFKLKMAFAVVAGIAGVIALAELAELTTNNPSPQFLPLDEGIAMHIDRTTGACEVFWRDGKPVEPPTACPAPR